jgi:predicted alpha/beta superfamily hydrolase
MHVITVAQALMRRLLKSAIAALAIIGIAYAVLLTWVWTGRTEVSINSIALGQQRVATVFDGDTDTTIYSLDGDKYRHGLLPAAHGALIAWVSGKQRPLFVAVHDHGGRDRDFRPLTVKPASWRPDISGRAPAFDEFLLRELRTEIERRYGKAKKRHLFGHSLGGYYALDMPTRQPNHGFSGIFSFSPTFSHDLSLMNRLAATCIASPFVYANIGLESDRDTEVFETAERSAKANSVCSNKLQFSRHPGMVHQLVMLTGQIAAFKHIYESRGT